MSTELTRHSAAIEPQTSETAATLAMLMHAAKDPNVKPENLERYLAMHRELLADQRKEAFNQAMNRLQPRLPRIKKNGRIEIVDKATGNVKQSTPFARYEDIDRAIRPLLQEEGFSISFNTEERATAGVGIIVHAKLSHNGGHSETSTMSVPLDSSGSKNNIQGMGSSLSYGKRYLVCAMLNIITEGEDTDGHQVTGPIDEREVNALVDLQKQARMDAVSESAFLKYMKVKSLSDIPRKSYPEAVNALHAKIRKLREIDNLPDLAEWPDSPTAPMYRINGVLFRYDEKKGNYVEAKNA